FLNLATASNLIAAGAGERRDHHDAKAEEPEHRAAHEPPNAAGRNLGVAWLSPHVEESTYTARASQGKAERDVRSLALRVHRSAPHDVFDTTTATARQCVNVARRSGRSRAFVSARRAATPRSRPRPG